MFETVAGPVTDERNKIYLRPETAQGIFTNYKNVVDTLYPDIPFGIAQIGKAFRNEISPRDFVFRSREFSQMEIEYFVRDDQWQAEFEKWVSAIKGFLESVGVDLGRVKEYEVPADDLAHYSKRTIDFEFAFPHGDDELLGLAYRTSFDLDNVARESGKSMEYRPKDGSPAFVPHVIEPSFGVERLVMAVLCSAYREDEMNGEKRVYLALPEHIAPVRFMVSPLLKNKPELVEKARTVYLAMKEKYGVVIWDDNSNVGKRYRRADEIGVPECITIDFLTLEDNTVTVRDRDSAAQHRMSIDDLTRSST
jgi:glycyl-tRNA synthetase